MTKSRQQRAPDDVAVGVSSWRDPRPSLTAPLERLLVDIGRRTADLTGLDVGAVLVVGLSAHGTAAASVRSLTGVATSVRVGGVRRHWELGLRPGFFLDGDAARRLATLMHELLHLDPARPGALLAERRHRVRPHAAHDRHARALARRWLDEADVSLLSCLAHDGEVFLRHWARRPIDETARRRFDDDDVFEAPLCMRTPIGLRSVWW